MGFVSKLQKWTFFLRSRTKSLRTLGFSFTDTELTHFGELVLLQRFCQQLQLRRRLQREVGLAHRRGDYRTRRFLDGVGSEIDNLSVT